MRDEMQRNPGTISGTPTAIPSMLARDPDPDLRFASASSFTVPHSSTLNLLNGAVGGLAMAFMLNVHEYPASESVICTKPGEYGFTMLADGTLRFYGTGVVDSSAPIPLDTDVFVTGVYNGGYSGDPKLGNATQGSLQAGPGADYRAGSLTGESNLHVCRFQALERGQASQIVMDLQRYSDVPYFQDVAAAAYGGTVSAVSEKLAQSDGQLLGSNALGTQPREWVAFPIEPFEFDEGDYIYLGGAFGAEHTSENPVMLWGYEASGGARHYKNAVVSASNAGPASQDLPDPWGSDVGSDAVKFAVYADYTPLARTGDEGHVLIYLDGQEDARAAYTSGVTAGTSDLGGPTFDVSMGEVLLWNRKLGPVEVAQLYAAR